jgi:glycosyltransferase involved in cell wall biosynthesis
MKIVSFVIPTLNEVKNVVLIYEEIKTVFAQNLISQNIDFEIIFVDDYSPDGTIDVVKNLRSLDARVKFIQMSRRFGGQICLHAGIEHAQGDAIIIMDADLQHPPTEIPRMIQEWFAGQEIVLMVREKLGHQSFLKKWSEIYFYKIMNWLSKTPIVYRFSGFCLFDKKVAREVRKFKEIDPFFRGIIGSIGFKQKILYFAERERQEGSTKYNYFQLFRLAITGVTNYSEMPLYFIFYLGFSSVFLSIIFGLWILLNYIILENIPPGWSSLILTVLLLGGVQMIGIGVLGIYLGKIFLQTKDRPRYIVNETGGL